MLGHPIIGHVVAERAGHALHAQLVSQLLRRKDSWTLTADEPGVSKSALPAEIAVHAAAV